MEDASGVRSVALGKDLQQHICTAMIRYGQQDDCAVDTDQWQAIIDLWLRAELVLLQHSHSASST